MIESVPMSDSEGERRQKARTSEDSRGLSLSRLSMLGGDSVENIGVWDTSMVPGADGRDFKNALPRASS